MLSNPLGIEYKYTTLSKSTEGIVDSNRLTLTGKVSPETKKRAVIEDVSYR